MARDDLAPRTSVWASAAWEGGYGVGGVEGLTEKLGLADEWGVEQMFVPAQNQPEVARWGGTDGTSLTVSFLSPVASNPVPSRILEPYLEVLGTEPVTGASIETCIRYHARVSRQRANEFAWRCLQDVVVERCREALPEACRPTHLVTVLSPEPAVVALAPAALRARHCLLLRKAPVEPRVEAALGQVRPYLEKGGVACQVADVRGDSFDEQLRSTQSALEAFLVGVPTEATAFDLTPGLKPLSLALEAAASRGSWLLYCQHTQGPDYRVIPTSQRFDCWLKGD
jgi:hypothetical protein